MNGPEYSAKRCIPVRSYSRAKDILACVLRTNVLQWIWKGIGESVRVGSGTLSRERDGLAYRVDF